MRKNKRSIKSDLKRVDAISEQDIDYTDSPALDDSFFQKMEVELPQTKDSVTLRLDHQVLEWFRTQGKGYQTKINAVLKAYVKAHL